jgi:two-component system, cell cycle sensor histidine kinase and response regulator CckA
MKKKLTILNLEDNPNDALLNKETLARDGVRCEIVLVETQQGYLKAIEQGGIDVILADYSLPDFDGLTALGLALEHCPEVPFLFVTGNLGEEVAIEAFKKGATDYVLKDRLSRLAPAVRRAMKEQKEGRERRQAEEALRISENTLKSIFISAPTGIGVTRRRVIEQVNDYFLEMVGYSREELIGQNARILYLTEEDFLLVGRVLNGHFREKRIGTIETCWRRKDEKIINVLVKSSPIDPENFSAGITFTALDITNHRLAEEALRRSEERQNKLIQQAFDIIYETDEFGFLKNVSPQTEQVFGIKPEELIGRHCQEIVKDSERERVSDQFQKALIGQGLGSIEFIGKKSDGSDVYCELRHIVEQVGDKVVGTFGVIRDLTEHHRMQAQLQQSQKMEAIGTLAGGIAHDFNNILGAIMGYTQLALGDLSAESPLKYNFEQVLKASNRAKDLVKQILTFSRQGDQEKGPVHVLPVINEALKLLRASLPKSIEIKKKLAIQEDMILGDPTKIHQVMMNLGTNAAQAMPDKKGVIEITLDELELEVEDRAVFHDLKPGPYLRMNISDTGLGIDPRDMTRIFDPFFTTKKPGEGTGMGLSVVHGIVKGLGGGIKVYSEPGKGTTFRIYLPRIKRTFEGESQVKKVLPTGNEHILFVDDEPGLVETWVQMLERLGYKVSSRGSSRDALALFRIKPDQFDLVITDQTMPHMCGTDLSREILSIRPDIPIILCSGFSETISPEEAKALGIREFLMKPILLGEIAVTIRKVLERKNG